ncbi:MAG: helix-turn-helix domain-containing protein [Bacilli bacterium]|jgi:hypothetical protein
MIKYYFFASKKDINVERFNDALYSAYSKIYEIHFFDEQNGYIVSDEYFYDSLESLIPVIMSDTDNSYTILMCHDKSELSRLAIKKAKKGPNIYLTNMADLLFNLVIDGDFDLFYVIKKKIDTIPRQLMLTAETFVSTGLNASLAAKKLYIHRNTFSYRLNQFIEATNLDIRDYHNAQFFSLVLRLISHSKFI